MGGIDELLRTTLQRVVDLRPKIKDLETDITKMRKSQRQYDRGQKELNELLAER